MSGENHSQSSAEDPSLALNAPAHERLVSWKEVAAYLGRDTRTVQRWEKTEGLPVHRHVHSKLGSIYAYRSELEQWQASRKTPGAFAMEITSAGAVDGSGTMPPASPTMAARVRIPALLQFMIGAALLTAGLGAGWFRTRHILTSVPVAPIPLTSYAGDEWAGSLSPDGTQIAYAWNGEQQDNFDIYAEVIGSRQRIRLTSNTATDCSPVWSPDGQSIAFMRATPIGLAALWVTSPASRVEVKLADTNTPVAPHARSLDWSPNGEWIVYPDREAPLQPTSLYLLSVRTGSKIQLTRPPAGQEDVQPAFSADGRSVLFVRDVGRGVSVIAVLSLDENLRPNGEPRHLHLKHFEKSGNSYPLWIGKNSEILFVSDRGGTERLWRVSARGGEPTLVASAGEGATLPTLSPFASKLVYTQGTFDTNIWAVDIAAGTARGAARPRKVISSTRLEHNPHVSPDASKLAFESSRSGYTEVWTSNLDGSHAAPLTNFRSSVTGSPQWAPDGKRVVFDSRVEGQPDLYVRGVEVEEVQRLTNHAAADVVPRWSRDGRWIYFASNRSGEFQVWKLPASGGEPVRVTKHGGFAAAESVDGKTLFYTKSRSDVTDLWRLTQHDGEEGPVLKSIIDRSFAVSHGGIYFLSAGPPVSLQFFSFATGRSTVLTTLNKAVQFGLALSPDGGTILFGQIDEQARDLMLIENFR